MRGSSSRTTESIPVCVITYYEIIGYMCDYFPYVSGPYNYKLKDKAYDHETKHCPVPITLG